VKSIVEQRIFDQEGFTWQQCKDDMRFLDYVWKAVWLANEGERVPTESDARARNFAHNRRLDEVVKHTEALLSQLGARRDIPG
jgi:hypothetical protein